MDGMYLIMFLSLFYQVCCGVEHLIYLPITDKVRFMFAIFLFFLHVF